MSAMAYRFIGDTSSPLAQVLGGMLTNDSNAQGVLIDGTNGSELPNAAAVMTELNAGRRLAFYKPSRTQLLTLRSIVGAVPLGDAGAVFMRKNGDGIQLFTQPTSVTGPYTGRSNTPGHGPNAMPRPPYVYSYLDAGFAFLKALQDEWPQSAPANLPLDGEPPPTTTPPFGTDWGTQTVAYDVALTWPWPGYVTGFKDSEWEGYGYQGGGNFSFGMTAYVYWCNGVTANPYFIVIVSFAGNQLAPMGVNTNYCKGYATGQVEVQGSNPVDGGGTAGAVTIQTDPPYPQPPLTTATITVVISVPGGTQAQQATVGLAPTLPVGWSATNNVGPNGFDWLWTQTDETNFLANPFDDFLTWWQAGFGGSFVNGPSQAGGTALPYQFVGIWQVNMPSGYVYKQGDPPPAVGAAVIDFQSVTYSATGWLMHSDVDCKGCYNDDDGDSEFCIWYGVPSNTQSFSLDLGQIASQNASPSPKKNNP